LVCVKGEGENGRCFARPNVLPGSNLKKRKEVRGKGRS